MTNAERKYLRRLHGALFWRLPSPEVREVLSDYEDFFNAGRTDSWSKLYEEFGPPREAAGFILRQPGMTVRPLGILAVVWTLLIVWLFQFRDGGLFRGLAFLLIPLLWLLWRRASYPTVIPNRRIFGLLCAAPLVIWMAYWGFVNCAVTQPTQWWGSLIRGGVSGVGQFVGALGDGGILVIGAVLLMSLLLSWGDSLWYMIPAAHALGCMAPIARTLDCLRCMDPTSSLREAARALFWQPLADYSWMALGGALLMVVLVWKGDRHGCAA